MDFTFNRLLTRFQIVQIVEEQLIDLCYIPRRKQRTRIGDCMAIRLHFLARMRFLEQLFGYLTKVIDKANRCVLLQRIINVVNVDISLVEQVMENVHRIDGS